MPPSVRLGMCACRCLRAFQSVSCAPKVILAFLFGCGMISSCPAPCCASGYRPLSHSLHNIDSDTLDDHRIKSHAHSGFGPRYTLVSSNPPTWRDKFFGQVRKGRCGNGGGALWRRSWSVCGRGVAATRPHGVTSSSGRLERDAVATGWGRCGKSKERVWEGCGCMGSGDGLTVPADRWRDILERGMLGHMARIYPHRAVAM